MRRRQGVLECTPGLDEARLNEAELDEAEPGEGQDHMKYMVGQGVKGVVPRL